VLARWILQAGDLVKVVVVELRYDRLASVLDTPEVDDPARLRIDRAFDIDARPV
jgi:hypothetical protein